MVLYSSQHGVVWCGIAQSVVYGMQPRTENVLGWVLHSCWLSARNLPMEQSPSAMSITAYCMVWFCMVWFCMVWYGVVLYGVVLYGVVLYGVEQEGSPWNSPQVHRSKNHWATSLPISSTHPPNVSLTRSSQCLTIHTYQQCLTNTSTQCLTLVAAPAPIWPKPCHTIRYNNE